MKTTRDEIMMIALRLFAQSGFDAVSTSMIASEIGITKGALYRHFASKQEIFDSIIEKMFELDEQQADKNNVPAKEYDDDAESYKQTAFGDICEFVNDQFVFWTENEFALLFRRMITIEQFNNADRNKLYQDVIALGPVTYTENLFKEMLKNGQLNDNAIRLGARNLAMQLFSPLQLSIQLFDGGEQSADLKDNLRMITKDFETRYMKK